MMYLRPVIRPADAVRRNRLAGFTAGVVVLLSVLPAPARSEGIRCLPPEPPMTALPDGVLAEYRTEIAAEYESYFAGVSDYITCLDRERARALSEARDATGAYAELLSTYPPRKDPP